MITDGSSVIGGGAPFITPNGRKLDYFFLSLSNFLPLGFVHFDPSTNFCEALFLMM